MHFGKPDVGCLEAPTPCYNHLECKISACNKVSTHLQAYRHRHRLHAPRVRRDHPRIPVPLSLSRKPRDPRTIRMIQVSWRRTNTHHYQATTKKAYGMSTGWVAVLLYLELMWWPRPTSMWPAHQQHKPPRLQQHCRHF